LVCYIRKYIGGDIPIDVPTNRNIGGDECPVSPVDGVDGVDASVNTYNVLQVVTLRMHHIRSVSVLREWLLARQSPPVIVSSSLLSSQGNSIVLTHSLLNI